MLMQEDLDAVRAIVREEFARAWAASRDARALEPLGKTRTMGSSVHAQEQAQKHGAACGCYICNCRPHPNAETFGERQTWRESTLPLPDGPLGACSRCGGEHIANHPCAPCVNTRAQGGR